MPVTLTDAKKIEVIAYIVDRQTAEQNDEEGDKHLSNPNYAMEAIEAVLAGESGNPVLRQFTEA